MIISRCTHKNWLACWRALACPPSRGSFAAPPLFGGVCCAFSKRRSWKQQTVLWCQIAGTWLETALSEERRFCLWIRIDGSSGSIVKIVVFFFSTLIRRIIHFFLTIFYSVNRGLFNLCDDNSWAKLCIFRFCWSLFKKFHLHFAA